MIFVHWGQGDRREFQGEAVFLAGLGVESLLVDAPWNRPGRKLDFLHHADAVNETVEDVRRGIDFLGKRRDVDAKRIAFVGHSFGAHAGAVLAGSDKRLVAFVLMGGVASAIEAWRTATHPAMVAARKQPDFDAAIAALAPIEPEKVVATATAPLFLQFARRDEFVPVEQAERLIAAAPPTKIYRFYEGDHGFGERARTDRVAWLALRLGVTPPATPGPRGSRRPRWRCPTRRRSSSNASSPTGRGWTRSRYAATSPTTPATSSTCTLPRTRASPCRWWSWSTARRRPRSSAISRTAAR